MRFRAQHTTEWGVVVKSDAFKRKRKEIKKRCKDILNDPCTAHNAHEYHHRWQGYWGAQLDARNRIIYTIDENEHVVTFCTIEDFHPW